MCVCAVRRYVSPLFETIPDLEGMPKALDDLLGNATYRELVRNNNNLQEVMLGYSDSCKDGGVFASQFGLYEAQKVSPCVEGAARETACFV